MRKHLTTIALALSGAIMSTTSAWADNKAVVADELAGFLEFSDYGGGTVFAEQLPADQYPKMMVIDVRDPAQYAKEHIPGAINIEWRQVLAQRSRIPTDKTVLVYCNTGTLSAQAGFALRATGHDNVRILQGGMSEWKAKGGLQANAKAAGTVPQH